MSGSCVIYSYMYFLCLIATQPCDLFMLCYAKSLQSCLTLCDPIDGSPPGSAPWDSPGKNAGVGCHFLLQLFIYVHL